MHEGHRARLRERYLAHGFSGFAPHEVLELLLTFSIPRQNTNGTGHLLMERFGSLEAVLSAEIPELMRVDGVGEKSAFLLHMCGDLSRRVQLEQTTGGQEARLMNAEDAARYAMELVRGERYECAHIISLNKNRGILHADRLSVGTLTETPLYPRSVVETALLQRAYAVMLVHNHPSGDPTPSEGDKRVTAAVETALRAIEIQLFDHLVVGRGMVYSFSRGIVMEFQGRHMRALLPGEVSGRLSTLPPAAPGLAAESNATEFKEE